ncbi:MAG TPA: hotdog fold domain-containing protein [Sandaracinaceae bacterium]
MNVAARVQSLLPSAEKRGNFVRDSWDRLAKVPGGKAVFSRLIGMAAPYTGSIGARVVELRRGYARTELEDRRRVRNHLDCVHAIALANLAELTGNVAVAYTLPDDARFIVAGMRIEYLKKARGTITGTSRCPLFDSSEKREHEIEVSLTDRHGDEVARAVLRTLVGPKKS